MADSPEDPITSLAEGAAQLHELFTAYVNAGFSRDEAAQDRYRDHHRRRQELSQRVVYASTVTGNTILATAPRVVCCWVSDPIPGTARSTFPPSV